jgi:hypothetical protein
MCGWEHSVWIIFVPVVRVLNGNHQDASFEEVFPWYIGRSQMIAFLNE